MVTSNPARIADLTSLLASMDVEDEARTNDNSSSIPSIIDDADKVSTADAISSNIESSDDLNGKSNDEEDLSEEDLSKEGVVLLTSTQDDDKDPRSTDNVVDFHPCIEGEEEGEIQRQNEMEVGHAACGGLR